MGYNRTGNWMVEDTPSALPSGLQWSTQNRGRKITTNYNDTERYMQGSDGQAYKAYFSDNPSFLETTILPMVATYLGGQLAMGSGLFGGTAAGASSAAGVGSAAGDVGLGSMATNAGGALTDLGFLDGMSAGSGLGGAATGASAAGTAGGLGSMIGVQGGAPAVVNIGAPMAASGGADLGLGGMGLGAGGASMAISNADLSGIDQAAGGINPGANNPSSLNNVNPVADAAASMPISNGSSLSDMLRLGQQGSSLLNGLGRVGSAINDYNTNSNNQQYWQNQMNTLTNMYAPGSPEANLMQQQMEAKDSAAGRNSQYGVRAVNLAAQLAQQKANIMTSPSYYNMGAASRGFYSNGLNGMFNMFGNSTAPSNNSGGGGSNPLSGIGSAINGISSVLGAGKNLMSMFGG